MKTTAELEQAEPKEDLATSLPHPSYALKVVVAYEDYPTREWARDLCDRVTRLVGQECVSSTWWRIDKLTHPAILPGAVEAARQADVIVVSVNGAEDLPLDLYAWIDAWLPRRQQQPGALVALIGGASEAPATGIQSYFQAVARRGGLDFLPRQCESVELPGAFPAASAAPRAYTTTQVLGTVLSDIPPAYQEWGINE